MKHGAILFSSPFCKVFLKPRDCLLHTLCREVSLEEPFPKVKPFQIPRDWLYRSEGEEKQHFMSEML